MTRRLSSKCILNPRPLYGGRLACTAPQKQIYYLFQSSPSTRRATYLSLSSHSSLRFQSTPSTRRTTPGPIGVSMAAVISIHALHTEDDQWPSRYSGRWTHFNPRPPHGGRHCRIVSWYVNADISIHALHTEDDLFPSRSASCQGISIHALHTEDDLQRASRWLRPSVFQSTPSTRRTTLNFISPPF